MEAVSPSPMSPEKRKAYRRHEDRQLRQRERELEAARRICQELSRHLNVDELVKRALKTALEVVNAEAGSVLLADAETKTLVFRYVIGEKADMLMGKAVPLDHGLASAIFHSGEAEVITDVKQDRRHLPDVDHMTGYHTRDMIVLPLKQWEGEPIGVLQVMNKQDRRFDTEDLSILTIISAVTSMVIEQAWLFEKAKLAEVARLLGDIGHDLKNLLQPVIGGAWLLKDDLDDLFNSLEGQVGGGKVDPGKLPLSHQRCNEMVAMLGDAGRRIQDRVREIADCVRGLSSPPHFAPCKLVDVVDSVLQTMRLLAHSKGVRLETEGLEPLPPIAADERRLYNALYNLVNNAIPEVPAGGSITLQGRHDPESDSVILTVIDTGRGMAPEIRDSLFTNQVISRKPGGTGLGTKIIKDVVAAHGGEISVESEVGHGTTFTIRLPLRPPLSATLPPSLIKRA